MTKTTVVVPDATRPIDYRELAAPLAKLAGEVTVLVGLGLHRPMSDAEVAPLAAACAQTGATLRQHDPATVVDAPSGARLAPELVQADRIVCVGVVEPHQYAGFSGGVKGAVIGCGSAETIARMHSLRMLRACGARVGWLDANPFQEELWRLAAGLPPIDGYFVVPGHPDVVTGRVRPAFETAVSVARRLHFREIPDPVGSILLRVTDAKATNFYQASRAATYVALAQRPAIREGGTIYLEAACAEGIGRGAGELACAHAMSRGRAELLAELEADDPPETPGGAQRAYVLAMALRRADIVLVGAPEITELRALDILQIEKAPPTDLVVADPFHAVPCLSQPERT